MQKYGVSNNSWIRITWAPRAAASRISFSARAMFASRSQLQAIWVAATVTMLMGECYLKAAAVPLRFLAAPAGSRCARSESRRRARADDLALLAAAVAEAVRQRAIEIISVPGSEDSRLSADGDFDLSFDDYSALLARMRQHLLARVGVRCIPLVQYRHAAFGQAAADEAQFNARRADIAQFLPRKKHRRLAAQVQREEIGQRHGDAVENLFQGAHRRAHAVLFDQRNQAVGHAGALRQLALREPVHLAHRFQMSTDVQAHAVYYNRRMA